MQARARTIPAKPSSTRLTRHHEAGIGDMGPATGAVGTQIVGPENISRIFRNSDHPIRCEPMRQRIALRHVARQSISLACADNRLHDLLDRIAIRIRRSTD